MAITADRVKETTTTSSTTSPLVLAGASTGFRAFATAFNVGDQIYFTEDDGTNWEVWVGTLTGASTLSKDKLLTSSNSNSPVTWATGTKNVYAVIPTEANIFVPDYLLHAQGIV